MHSVGVVLHPKRDSAEAVNAVLGWAARKDVTVYGIGDEITRLNCLAKAVTAVELGQLSDLVVSLGGDGTMLRAMRIADGQHAPVLGVNLGKLGFLAEVDVPDLPDALSAIDARDYTMEPRLAVDSMVAGQRVTAFNDIAVVRVPGDGGSALVALHVGGQPFVSYAADAVVIATPTGSTAYSFSAGGPIVSPAVEALLVTPAAPHSAYNRGLVLSVNDTVAVEVLRGSGQLAVEVDGQVAGYIGPGDMLDITPRPAAARVVRLGRTTFYQRARRKLRIVDSAELAPITAVPDVHASFLPRPDIGHRTYREKYLKSFHSGCNVWPRYGVSVSGLSPTRNPRMPPRPGVPPFAVRQRNPGRSPTVHRRPRPFISRGR
jgi:NAD+ kinase